MIEVFPLKQLIKQIKRIIPEAKKRENRHEQIHILHEP